MPRKYTTKERITAFWDKVNKDGSVPEHCPAIGKCWEWTGGKKAGGYGTVYFHGKMYGAHCIAWELEYGAIPTGLNVCHACDNPSCCNPKHLWVGTDKDNAQDKNQKGRGNNAKGEQSGRHKLTERDVIAIRNEYVYGIVGMCQLAKRYHVTQGAISRIITRKNWKHVQ